MRKVIPLTGEEGHLIMGDAMEVDTEAKYLFLLTGNPHHTEVQRVLDALKKVMPENSCIVMYKESVEIYKLEPTDER